MGESIERVAAGSSMLRPVRLEDDVVCFDEIPAREKALRLNAYLTALSGCSTRTAQIFPSRAGIVIFTAQQC